MQNKKKKLLLINNSYPTKSFPKRGAYVKSIEECLLQAEIEVHKIVLNCDYLNKIEKLRTYIKFYTELLFFKDYKNYDYIYIHHFPYVFLPLIFHFHKMSKVVINFHGEDIVYTSRFSKWLNAISYKFLLTKFIYIFPSKYFKDLSLEAIPKLKLAKSYVSPSGGVDTNIFKPVAKKSKDPNVINIGFASGLLYNKGVEDLIYFLERFNNSGYVFHIIDYGKERGKYINTIKAFENTILYKPFKKQAMPTFYSKLDVLFFPTKSESLGLVALEAMSCNVPVIGPDAFSLKEIIINGLNGEKYNLMANKGYLSAFNEFKNKRSSYKPLIFIEKSYSKKRVIKQFKQIFS